MNKNFKTVWSDSLGTYVVVSERTKGKTKSSKAKQVIVASAASAIISSAAMAADLTVSSGQNLDSQILSSSDSLTVEKGGTISATSITSTVAVDFSSGADETIFNEGTISARATGGTNAQAILIEGDLNGNFDNSGTISATIKSSSAYATGLWVENGDQNGTFSNTGIINANAQGVDAAGAYAAWFDENTNSFDNAGVISAKSSANDYASSYALYIGDSNSGNLNNSGTISAVATSANSDAFAYGVWVNGSVDGSFTNSGIINANATGNSLAAAYGAQVTGDIDGNFTNTGTISAVATSTGSDAYSYGLYVGDSIVGNFTNSGTISAVATAASYAEAYGLYVGDSIVGNFTNSGTISAVATGGTEAYAYGAYIGDSIMGSFTNSGTISAVATSTSSHANAYGFYGGAIGGDFTNSGTISAVATAASYANAYGLYLGGDVLGNFTNSGTISAVAKGGTDAVAYGAQVTGDIDGNFTNTGTISAVATSNTKASDVSYGAYAEALFISDSIEGTFTNTGTISAVATSYSGDAEAYGAYVEGSINGNVTNTGTISASADAASNALAYGFHVGGSSYGNAIIGSFTNSGTISAAANAASYADAYGLHIDGSIIGSFTNTGLISGTATAINNAAYAYGAYVYGSIEDSFTNSGEISAVAKGGTEAYAYGVYLDGSVNGSFTNTGTISARATADSAHAYGFYGGAIQGNFSNTGLIEATATSNTLNASAYGLAIYGSIDGNFTNSGTISAQATSASYAGAYGLYVADDINGNFTNSGTISAIATAIDSEAYSYGAYINGSIDGSFTNSGTIKSVATSENYHAASYGLYVGDSINGAFTNSGLISATAVSSSYANAYGVIVDNSINGGFTNSGSILASATSTATNSRAHAYGVFVDGSINGAFTNTGTISAIAKGATREAAYGVYIEGSLTGNFTNTGLIRGLEVNNHSGYSLYLNNASSDLVLDNSGILDGAVYINGGMSVNNSGILNTRLATSSIDGNFTQTDSGVFKLSASSPSNYGSLELATGIDAILADHTTVAVHVTPGSDLSSSNRLNNVIHTNGSGTLTVNSETLNVKDTSLQYQFTPVADNWNNLDLNYTDTGMTTTVAAMKDLKSAQGLSSMIDKELDNFDLSSSLAQDILYNVGTSDSLSQAHRKVESLLPTGTGNGTQVTHNTLGTMNQIIESRQSNNLGLSAGDQFLGDKSVWFKPFGSYADQSRNDNVSGFTADTYGAMFGIDAKTSDTNSMGVSFGYARTNTDPDNVTSKIHTKTYQLGLYGNKALPSDYDISWQAALGHHKNNENREIDGLGHASGKYDSLSLTASAQLSKSIKLDDKSSFIPSAKLSYSYLDDDSYKESGKFGLNVAGIDNHKLVASVDAKYVYKPSNTTALSANLGAGYDVIQDNIAFNASFNGDPSLAFKVNGMDPSPWTVKGGLGATVKNSDNLDFSARYDLTVKESYVDNTGSVKVRWTF
jgi:hypothetical protein